MPAGPTVGQLVEAGVGFRAPVRPGGDFGHTGCRVGSAARGAHLAETGKPMASSELVDARYHTHALRARMGAPRSLGNGVLVPAPRCLPQARISDIFPSRTPLFWQFGVAYQSLDLPFDLHVDSCSGRLLDEQLALAAKLMAHALQPFVHPGCMIEGEPEE